jgi:hypothetical protein
LLLCATKGDIEFAFDRENIIRHLTEYFTKLYSSRSGGPLDCPYVDLPPPSDFGAQSLHLEISVEELDNATSALPWDKARGPNDIPNEVWKILPNDDRTKILECFNYILLTMDIPLSWRHSMIFMLYKGGGTRSPDNHRGISLLNTDYKLFTTIPKSRVEKFVADNDILSPLQYGATKGKSTSHAVKTLTNIIADANANKRELHVVYIDFHKAYD